MATLAAIVWIIVLFLFFKEFFGLMGSATEEDSLALVFFQFILVGLILGHGIIIVPISVGIFFDLYGKFPSGELTTIENLRLALISGFIALGTFSVSSFLIDRDIRNNESGGKNTDDVHYSRLPPNRYSITVGKSIMLGVEAIGLISSVLGIISFYLDYLK